MRYTETKVYDIQRQGDMNVDSVARNALKKANRKLIDGVLPYRLNEKKEFSMGYLSGFVAENRLRVRYYVWFPRLPLTLI